MSATVETVYLYEAHCSECGASSGRPHEDEHLAYEWAANHDAENHATDDGLDDDYETFRETRYDEIGA